MNQNYRAHQDKAFPLCGQHHGIYQNVYIYISILHYKIMIQKNIIQYHKTMYTKISFEIYHILYHISSNIIFHDMIQTVSYDTIWY